jgi:uncharacterized protein YwqG
VSSDAAALYALYLQYATGDDVEPDVARAMAFLRESAERGYAEAQYSLGREIFAEAKEDALVWFSKAADQGHADARLRAARMLLDETSILRDEARGFDLLERSAAEGSEDAASELQAAQRRRDALAKSDRDNLRAALRDHDLESISVAVEASVRSSIRLVTRAAEDAEIPVGACKLGGAPDLTVATAWPANARGALSFLAQIDLGAIARVDPNGPLAGFDGLLSFFYDANEQPWGFAKDGLEDIRVIHHARASGTIERRAQASAPQFRAASLQLFAEETIPGIRTAAARSFSNDQSVLERYGNMEIDFTTTRRRSPTTDGDVHRLLGHPDAIQGDMTRRLEYGLAGKNLEQDDVELDAAARSWRLLFQLDSDRKSEMMWGDLGRLYFWMREDDLCEGRWERVHYQLQCS